jgi:hypothetical protein
LLSFPLTAQLFASRDENALAKDRNRDARAGGGRKNREALEISRLWIEVAGAIGT